jgi:hypothetical protein
MAAVISMPRPSFERFLVIAQALLQVHHNNKAPNQSPYLAENLRLMQITALFFP